MIITVLYTVSLATLLIMIVVSAVFTTLAIRFQNRALRAQQATILSLTDRLEACERKRWRA